MCALANKSTIIAAAWIKWMQWPTEQQNSAGGCQHCKKRNDSIPDHSAARNGAIILGLL